MLGDEKPRRQRSVCGSRESRALGQGPEWIEEQKQMLAHVDLYSVLGFDMLYVHVHSLSLTPPLAVSLHFSGFSPVPVVWTYCV